MIFSILKESELSWVKRKKFKKGHIYMCGVLEKIGKQEETFFFLAVVSASLI